MGSIHGFVAATAHGREKAHYSLLQLLQLVNLKRFIPSEINKNLDPSIKLKQGLGRGRVAEGALQRAKGKHFLLAMTVDCDGREGQSREGAQGPMLKR